MTTEEAPFAYHREYLNILFELNIADDQKVQFIKDNTTSESLLSIFEQVKAYDNIATVMQVLNEIQN
jgi:hypothetical protein